MDFSERTPQAPKQHHRPLVITSTIATIVVLVGAVVWTAQTLQSHKLNRWLPERAGNATVLSKGERGADLMLEIRLDVPPASPAEAALIPEDTEGRDAMVGAHTFETSVHVDRAQWDAAQPGTRLRAMYHINAQRSEVFVPTVYLDAMDAGATPQP